jgi:hypothetical protein
LTKPEAIRPAVLVDRQRQRLKTYVDGDGSQAAALNAVETARLLSRWP